MQAYEMWNPQVAVLSAPASARKSRATVRRTHGMRPHDRHSLSGVRAGQLSSGRVRHETRTKSTDDRDDHPKSKGPAHRRIFKPLPPEGYSHGYADEGLRHDGHAHDDEQNPIEGRAEVEVAGGASVGLQGDDREFQHHRDCCGPPDHTARLPPFG